MAKGKNAANTPAAGKRPTSDPRAALHGAGLRRTVSRIAVLHRLASASAPLSHGELASMLAGDGFDRATVYRNLVDLVEAGLVRRADLGDHVWRFELVIQAEGDHATQHPHFVCVDCGNVSCLPQGSVRVTGGRGRPRALTRRALEVRLRGRCDQCAG